MNDRQTQADVASETARQRIFARYRDPELAERLSSAGWNETQDVMLSHRSVRSYLDRPVAPEVLELIIAAAQSAPTTSNLHALSVIAVQDPDRKARLARFAASQKHIFAAPLLLVFVADLARLRTISEGEKQPGIALDFIEAFIIAIADAAFAAQNALVALQSLGLGGCYIGAMRNDPYGVADELGLPDESMVVFGMTVGYPDPAVETDVKPRLSQRVVLHRERYQKPDQAVIDDYNRHMRDFQAEQSMRAVDWTQQAAARVRDEAALTGRHVLTDFLRERGFGMK